MIPSPQKCLALVPVIGCVALCGLCVSDTKDADEVSDREDRAKMIRRIIEAANVPIEFWGKVTDQDGVPLEGVKIAYTGLIIWGNDVGVAWTPKEHKGQAVTDAAGSFAINGFKSNSLGLDSFSKPGYVYRGRANNEYDFADDTPAHKFVPRRDSPVCFAMVNERTLEPLIQLKGSLRVSGDGVPAHWNLWEGEPDPDGEFMVAFRCEPAVLTTPRGPVPWAADIQIVGGEIIQAAWAEEFHRAPESGYSAIIPYSKEPAKQGIIGCAYYLRTRNGNYGRITVELRPGYDGSGARCFITSDMNPHPGSRNLESFDGD